MKKYVLPSIALFGCMIASAQQERGGIKAMCTLFERLQSYIELSESEVAEACKKDITSEQENNALSVQTHTVKVGEESLLVNIADMVMCGQLFLETLLEAASKNEQASQQDKAKINNMINHLSHIVRILNDHGISAHNDKSFLQENLLAVLQAISASAKSE